MEKPSFPRHVAIIMDGNGRWAEARGLERAKGHRQGAEAVMTAVETAGELGIEYLTLYAFSTENWKRPVAEVTALMGLLEAFIDQKLPELQQRNVRLKTIGRTAGLPAGARNKLLTAIDATRENTAGTLVLALNYGGRAELADAMQAIAAEVKAGRLKPQAIDEKVVARHLYDPELPDPDLLIRTSGEFRLSNFLLWELAYSELYVTDVLWPDFSRAEFLKAVESYGCRERRFGGRKG